jgi:hypothetical protein
MADSIFKKARYAYREASREEPSNTFSMKISEDEFYAFINSFVLSLAAHQIKAGKIKTLPTLDFMDHKKPAQDFVFDIGEYSMRGGYNKEKQAFSISSNKPLPYSALISELELVNALAFDNSLPIELMDETNPLRIISGKALPCARQDMARLYCDMLGRIAILHQKDPLKIKTSMDHNPPLVIVEGDLLAELREIELIPGNSLAKHTGQRKK